MRSHPKLLGMFILALLFVFLGSNLLANEETVEMRLQRVKSLGGVVVLPNGDPVVGAQVVEYSSDWHTELRRTETDSQGHFALTPVKGRKLYYLQITARDAHNVGINPLRVPLQISRFRGKDQLVLRLKLA